MRLTYINGIYDFTTITFTIITFTITIRLAKLLWNLAQKQARVWIKFFDGENKGKNDKPVAANMLQLIGSEFSFRFVANNLTYTKRQL